MENAHTPKAVGSRHLCFQSQHSYYGFHVACKVLCICFDHSLLGLPPHIKMLGIHLLGTNNPCEDVKGGALISNITIIIFKVKKKKKEALSIKGKHHF